MASKTVKNGIVDAVKALILANITTLGGTSASRITEGDEEPTYLEREGYGFPCFFVVPLVEGGDRIHTHMGGTLQDHDFPITVIGYYKTDKISDGIRTTSDYGYDFVDLIAGKHLTGTGFGGYLLDPVLDIGYQRVVDNIVHWWIVRFDVKTKGGP